MERDNRRDRKEYAMRIAIIGAGNVGGTLGKMWAAKGHEVAFGVRSPNDAKVQTLVTVTGQRARAVSMKDAVVGAEVVALATPWSAVESAIKDAGDLRGKVLVDATNPLKPDLSGLALGHSTSAGAHVAAWAPGAKVVKAFNTIGAAHMADPRFGTQRANMFLCGDDTGAKTMVAGLAGDLGFDPVDCGPLTQARLLDPLAMLWISMVYAYGAGPNIGFALLRK
jgi:predicted dinucleotide-binding enzyme